MSDPEILPSLDQPIEAPRARWRWGVHLFVLAGYVLGLGLIGSQIRESSENPGSAMPHDVIALAKLCAFELVFFLAVYGVALMFSRARPRELFLNWRGGAKPLWWGIVYSIILRVVIVVIAILVAIPFIALKGEKAVEKARPKIEAVVDTNALKDPVYLLFAVTVISFVLAGFREEFWRAGILAGLSGVAPRLFGSRAGQYWAVALAAILFGLGHLPQGIGGVFLTGALGFGLGCIIVRHQSIWEATLAHGFFDATTFGGLYLLLKYLPDSLKNFGIGS